MKKEKIIQICAGSNNNPTILTSSNRILQVVAYPIHSNGNICNYGYMWKDITPKLEEIK